jgi:hypothetical protein
MVGDVAPDSVLHEALVVGAPDVHGDNNDD